jgi:hypothetical protein
MVAERMLFSSGLRVSSCGFNSAIRLSTLEFVAARSSFALVVALPLLLSAVICVSVATLLSSATSSCGLLVCSLVTVASVALPNSERSVVRRAYHVSRARLQPSPDEIDLSPSAVSAASCALFRARLNRNVLTGINGTAARGNARTARLRCLLPSAFVSVSVAAQIAPVLTSPSATNVVR